MQNQNIQVASPAEVLAMMKGLLAKPIPPELLKTAGWSQPGSATTGMQAYNLEPRARMLFPVLSPLRNMIPRVGGGFGTAVNWKALTGINTTLIEPGTMEGARNQYITHTTADYNAAYKTLSLDDFVTEQAQWAGRTFEDILAMGTDGLLWSLMIAEEQVTLGGLSTFGLNSGNATPTPTVAASGTGGSLAHGTLSVICVALTHAGFYSGSVANGIRGLVTGTTVDGKPFSYGGGSAKKSVAGTATVPTGTTGSATAHVANVTGAMGYAWFWGGSGSEVLGAITTINSVKITANAAGSQTAASLGTADNSANNLVYDGILSQLFKSGSNAQIITQATGVDGVGTPLTADGEGSIVEFDTILRALWDNARVAPNIAWMNSQERQNVQKKVQAGGVAATQRFIFDVNQKTITGGSLVTGYINKFGMAQGSAYAEGSVLEFRTHPNIAPGTILFTTDRLPYMNSRVPNVWEIETRLEYYQRPYPQTSPAYTFAVMFDGVLKGYAPFAQGYITNIGNG